MKLMENDFRTFEREREGNISKWRETALLCGFIIQQSSTTALWRDSYIQGVEGHVTAKYRNCRLQAPPPPPPQLVTLRSYGLTYLM